MTQTTSSWRADPLTWGKGPRVFEVFLEPTCPFSAKAFGKLDETLAREASRSLFHPNLDREIKWHTSYARQNGIHASPTFVIDGMVQSDMTSGDSVSDWVSRLSAS